MKYSTFVVILLFFVYLDSNIVNAIDYEIGTKIIVDFLKYYNLKLGTILVCWNANQVLKVSKVIMQIGVRINIVNNIENIESVLDLLNADQFYYQAVILDSECPGSVDFLEECSNNRMFNTTYHWLIFNDIPNNVIPVFSNLNLNIDTEVILASPQTNSIAAFDLYEVYNPGYHYKGKLNVTKIGNWTKTLGYNLFINLKQTKFERRINMSDIVLKCMIVVTQNLNEPFMDYVTSHRDTHLDSMHRYSFAILSHVRDMFNFKFVMYRTKSWGYLGENNTFDGMIGGLARKEMDIGGSPSYFWKEREEVVDYTCPTWPAKPCFIYRHPNSSALYNAFLEPFATSVWLLTIVYCFLFIILLRVIVIAEHLVLRSMNDVNYPKPELAWSFQILLLFGAVCQQGTSRNPILTSGRIMLLQIFLFAVLFYQFYSASIVSSLLMTPPRTIKTVEDLINSPLEVGIEDVLYNHAFFNKTNDPVALKLYSTKVLHGKDKIPAYMSSTEGVRKIQHGGFAFNVDIAAAYKIISDTFSEREMCDLEELYLYPPQWMVGTVQKGSPFRKLITYGLRKVKETGLMSYQFRIWLLTKPKCMRKLSPKDFNVGLREMSSAFLMLLGGMMMSTGMLIVERLTYKRTEQEIIYLN